jgi:exosortase
MFSGFQNVVQKARSSPGMVLAGAIVGGALAWVYWPTLVELVQRWSTDPKYSHGYLVPLFALYLLAARASPDGARSWRPSWWGLPVLALGLAVRLAGTLFYIDWLSAVSLLPVLAGLVLAVGGWPALARAWPAIAFLFFMIPLPFQLERALAGPLQRVGTLASVYALQTLGFVAHAEGNIIVLRHVRIGVVEACNGLSMLMIFMALSTAVVMLIQRPLLDKAIILVSAIPIALVCNIIRITVTGVLHMVAGPKLAELVFHDLAGWLMMPLALGLLWCEVKVLDWVLMETHTPAPVPLAGVGKRSLAAAEPSR